MAFHAKLSPSSAHRWMNCAGSVKLIGDEPNSAGMPAMMGTAAHKVIEVMLQKGERDASAYHNWSILVHFPGTEETRLYPPGSEVPIIDQWFLFVCDDKMVAGVQMMIDEVDRVMTEECFDPALHTERYLDMSWLDSRLGGTADVTVVDPDWIHLLDYKNGRVIVEVEDNEQMMNYAVGLLHEHPDARGVTVHLVQPNAVHEDGCIREQSYSADRLKLFEIQMKDAAMATAKPNAPRRAGAWCTYCPGKAKGCKEFENVAMVEAGMDFAADPVESPPLPVVSDDVTMSNEIDDGGAAYRASLARRRKWVPVILQFAKDINKLVFAELMNGHDVGGLKLVRGKSNRAYIDDAETTAAALIDAGIPQESLYTEPELKSPAQVEKIRPLPAGMKPKDLKTVVAGLAHKPPGKISIAEADDPREAIDPATDGQSDFADDPVEGDESDFGA